MSEFKLDWSDYDEIVKSVEQSPEEYRPHKHWLDYEQRSVQLLKDNPKLIYSVDVEGVPGWVGGGTAHHIPWKHYDRYIEFVKSLDHLKLLDKYTDYHSRQFLDAVAEINLLHQYGHLSDGKVILDLGGGYGRLAEFLLSEFKVSYVIVEAVALSLLIAPQYIQHRLNVEVNSYWDKRDFSFLNYPLSVFPTWEIDHIIPKADIILNIHSMQEMGDEKTAFYLNKFSTLKSPETVVFLKNNYHYITRTWSFPKHWQVLYEHTAWPCTEGLVDGKWQAEPRTWVKIYK